LPPDFVLTAPPKNNEEVKEEVNGEGKKVNQVNVIMVSKDGVET